MTPSTIDKALFVLALTSGMASIAAPASAEDTCLATLASSSTSGSIEDVYARGRTAYEAKRYAEAAALFRAVAFDHPETALAVSAAQLSLDAMNNASPAPSTACIAPLAADAARYVATLCASDPPIESRREACTTFRRIVVDAARLEGDTIMRSADGLHDGTERALYARAGDAYIAAFQKMEAACIGHTSECDHADELVYNATRAFQAGKAFDRTRAARAILLDPKFGLDKTPLAGRVLFEEGQDSVAFGEFERAATLFERFVARSPAAEHAQDAIENALVLRMSLRDYDRASKLLVDLERVFGANEGVERLERVKLAFAEDLVERADWSRAERLLRAMAKRPAPRPAFRVRGDSLLADALFGLGKRAEAEQISNTLAHIDPTNIVPPPNKGDIFDAQDFSRVAKAVARAILRVGDVARDKAMKLDLKKAKPETLDAKMRAISAAETVYGRILALATTPPPKEVVAAAHRIARMRAQLWGQAYLALGPDEAAPHEKVAVATYEHCAKLEVTFEAATDETSRCAEWLEHHDPAHHPPLTELLPRAHYTSGSLNEPMPLTREGQPAWVLTDAP